MGLQTCKYFTMEKYGAPQMFMFAGEVYGVITLAVSTGRTCRTSFMLPMSF